MIQPHFYDVLDRLIAAKTSQTSNKNKVILNIITNLGASEKYIDRFTTILPSLIEKFNVQLDVSIESTEERAEYIRSGLNWNLFTRNIEKVLSLKLPIRFGFHSCINVFCIPRLADIIHYAVEIQKKYNISVYFKDSLVINPAYLSPFVLPSHFSHHLIECAELVDSKLDSGNKEHRYFSDFLRQIAQSLDSNTPDFKVQKILFHL